MLKVYGRNVEGFGGFLFGFSFWGFRLFDFISFYLLVLKFVHKEFLVSTFVSFRESGCRG